MAEIIDLNINIGANTTDFEGALQKAENLLKQFESALKKATNVGEINYLNTQIKGLQGTISGIKTQMGGVAKPTNDATQSLINFSRIAQDAPYGIMGIANNLNPMLESFQQLAKTEGGTKKALTAMIDGLAGPAGIGVALGLVSSLAVVFQKQITEAFEGPAGKLKDLREELKKLNDEIYRMAGSAQASQTLGTQLVGRITNENLDITQRENALRKFKELYGKNKEIKDLEIKDLKSYNAQYLQSLNNKAAVQQLEVSKEQNYIDALSAANSKYKKLVEERDNKKKNTLATTKQLESGTTTEKLRSAIDAEFVAPIKEAQQDIANAKASLSRTLDITTLFDNSESGKKTTTKKAPIVNYAKQALDELNDYVKKLKDKVKESEFVLKNESFKLFELPSDGKSAEKKRKGYFQGKEKDLLEESNRSGFGAFVQNKIKQDKADIDSDEARKKRLQDLNKKYSEIAQNVSQNVTGALFGMYDAMQEGLSAGEALGQMFSRLARSIAESLVQAALFAGILSLISGGAAGGGVSFFGAFKGILGLASGGVATGPTLAMIGEGSESEAVLPLSKLGNIMQGSFNAGSMNTNSMAQNGQFVLKGNDLVLALQRSNSSLNLRRGI
jgi:hypothetical protein